jgi:hypothetical protein
MDAIARPISPLAEDFVSTGQIAADDEVRRSRARIEYFEVVADCHFAVGLELQNPAGGACRLALRSSWQSILLEMG